MIKRHAFTLTETLIMVAVIGIIAVISAISLKNIQPDKDTVMVRKAYSEASKAVATLINDQELYPYAEVSLKNKNDILLATVLQRSLAAACTGLNCPDQTTKIDDEMFSNGSCTIIYRPSSSGTSSYNNTLHEWASHCYMLASGNKCVEGSQGNGYYCFEDCSEGCDTGYTYNETTKTCEPSSSSSGSSSSSSGGPLPPIGSSSNNNTNASDLSKKTGNSSSSNLKDGSYDDTNYSGTSTTSTVALNPHGTVFLNTKVMNGATGYTSENKFAYNFAGLFKTNNRVCNGSVCTFTTEDGMDWTVTDGFQSGNANTFATIQVDVNGAGTQPNSANDLNPDIFTFKVDPSGQITVDGNDKAAEKARSVLKDRSKR